MIAVNGYVEEVRGAFEHGERHEDARFIVAGQGHRCDGDGRDGVHGEDERIVDVIRIGDDVFARRAGVLNAFPCIRLVFADRC